MNNYTPHLKPPKNQNRRVAIERLVIKLVAGGGGGGGGLKLVCGRATKNLIHIVALD